MNHHVKRQRDRIKNLQNIIYKQTKMFLYKNVKVIKELIGQH